MTNQKRNQIARIENDFLFNARYYMPGVEQKVLLFLVSQLEPKKQEDFHVQLITVKELERYLKTDEDTKWGSTYDRLDEFTRRLSSRQISFNSQYAREGKPIRGFINWFQSAIPVENDKGELCIKFRFSEDLKPVLLSLNEYVRVNGIDVAPMRGGHAIHAYQIFLAARRKNQSHSPISTYESEVEEFKAQLGIPGTYAKLKDFRRRVLDPIKEQINQHSREISVDYKYIKTGRKVTSIRWVITDKKKSNAKQDTIHKDYKPAEEEINQLTKSKKQTYSILVEFGVFPGIAFKQIIPTIGGSEVEGWEDHFITFALRHFKKWAENPEHPGVFVNWWLEQKVFDPSGDVFGLIMEQLTQVKKRMQEEEPVAYENRFTARTMTSVEFNEWYRGQG